jgi:CheY-like chemotaxis protein
LQTSRRFSPASRAYLENSGYHVLAVASGEEKLRATQESFEVVLRDEEMPGMAGTQVLQKIRSEEKIARELAVIALTGYNTETDKERLLKAGFVALLGKAFRLDALEAILGDCAAGKIPQNTAASTPATAASAPRFSRASAGMTNSRSLWRSPFSPICRRASLEMEKAIRQKQGEALVR